MQEWLRLDASSPSSTRTAVGQCLRPRLIRSSRRNWLSLRPNRLNWSLATIRTETVNSVSKSSSSSTARLRQGEYKGLAQVSMKKHSHYTLYYRGPTLHRTH